MPRKKQIKEPYESISDVPPLCFWDRFYTEPASQDTYDFLQYMLSDNKQALKGLHRRCQEYIDYGGAYKITWTKWLERLTKNLEKSEYNNQEVSNAQEEEH